MAGDPIAAAGFVDAGSLVGVCCTIGAIPGWLPFGSRFKLTQTLPSLSVLRTGGFGTLLRHV